jgi:ornithine cyclodeaminase
MAIILREADVIQVLDMKSAIPVIEDATRNLTDGSSRNGPRQRLRLTTGWLHLLPGADEKHAVLGAKIYTSFRDATRFLLVLYSSEGGRLRGLVEGNYLGMIRTGAVSAVATKYLARENADVAAVIGTGWQARGQILGLVASRSISSIRAYGRDEPRRMRFCEELSAETGVDIVSSESVERAVDGAGIVVTATTSRTPVLLDSHVVPGMHINAVGANTLLRQEIDVKILKRAAPVVVDSRSQAKQESGDLLGAVERGWFDWDRLPELSEVVAYARPGRQSERDITLFESHGLGVHDIALAGHVLAAAEAAGIGEELSLLD